MLSKAPELLILNKVQKTSVLHGPSVSSKEPRNTPFRLKVEELSMVNLTGNENTNQVFD